MLSTFMCNLLQRLDASTSILYDVRVREVNGADSQSVLVHKNFFRSSGLIAHENSTFRKLALAVSVPFMA